MYTKFHHVPLSLFQFLEFTYLLRSAETNIFAV